MKHTKTLLVTFLLLGDILVFALGYLVSSWIVGIPIRGISSEWLRVGTMLAVLLFFFVMYDLYTEHTEKVFDSAVSVGLSIIIGAVAYALLTILFHPEVLTFRLWIVRLLVQLVFLVPYRTAVAAFIKKFGKTQSCLILENMNNTSRLARKLKYASNYGRESTYYMIDEENEEEIERIINEKIPEYEQIFISPAISEEVAHRFMRRAMILQKEIGILADLDNVTTLHGRIYQLDDTPIIEKKVWKMTRMQRLIKRLFDLAFAIVLSILTAPVAAVCAIAVARSSEGPVIYKQERYTKGKKRFYVYKFRTMVADAEKNGARLATEDDPRITKVGKFLRATRLDELPQIYNILLGSMSVVGPRPERPIFADEYSRQVQNYDMRYSVKAGLTGYAQVYGKYNTRVSDKILMDMIYIVNYSLLLDIKLILLTAKTMFVKSATEGIDEERDAMLSASEKETERRSETAQQIYGAEENDEDIRDYSGV